ncbi:MAG: carbohydrate ABC transporter permease [Anaerolineaceae bacterium]|nr:carbohydrate ABC transporter permease [Anaerolineaceae bacterium]
MSSFKQTIGSGYRRQPVFARVFYYIVLVFSALLFLLPLFWAFSSSLKPDYQVMAFPPVLIPHPLRWENFSEALAYVPLGKYMLNTLIIALGATIGNLISCTLVAYGFARLRAPGKQALFLMMLGSVMLVEPARIIPLYVEFSALGWIDSFLPLIVPAFFGSPLYIFMLRQFFMNIPRELEDAALLDGANRLQTLWKIFLPLSRPALTVIIIFNFQGVWSDFLQPLVFLQNQNNYTISLGLSFFRNTYSVQWGHLMAAAVIAMLPMIVLYAFAQKQFIQGIALEGIKG